jgi:hypothetical protein
MSVDTLFHKTSTGFVIERTQDVEPILQVNHELRSQSQRSDFIRHLGRVPNVVLEGWFNDELKRGNTQLRWGSKEFWELCHRRLRDGDYIKLRVDSQANQFRVGYK